MQLLQRPIRGMGVHENHLAPPAPVPQYVAVDGGADLRAGAAGDAAQLCGSEQGNGIYLLSPWVQAPARAAQLTSRAPLQVVKSMRRMTCGTMLVRVPVAHHCAQAWPTSAQLPTESH